MRAFLTPTLLLLLPIVPATVASQTFQVIHNFTGGNDGSNPTAGVTLDHAGNLYGTAAFGGRYGYGAIYKLSLHGGWVITPLYSFQAEAYPESRVVFGADGTLYGTTVHGGSGSCDSGCGTVFNLTPPPRTTGSLFASWDLTVVFRFDDTDGGNPSPGDLVFDSAGSIYGTTSNGGDLLCSAPFGCGTAYQLTHSSQGWTQTLLYVFHFDLEGQQPMGGLVFDSAGNLYGTTSTSGMYGWGTAFQLAPSGGQWTLNTIYAFMNGADGGYPAAGLAIDSSNNLYGTTAGGGSGGAGTVFELIPSGGRWNFDLLYSLVGNAIGSQTPLTMDSAGNLYGVTEYDGPDDQGTVFKLSRSADGWTYTLLHGFTGGADGGTPLGQLTIDSNGNIYGTTKFGGANPGCFDNGGCGVVFEITQN
jgi:uncharacterized repeat protein (TIGR03803 family)